MNKNLEAQEILNSLSFSYPEAEESLSYEILKKKIVSEIEMPAFYTFSKANKKTYTINVNSSSGLPIITITAQTSGQAFGGTFGDIEKAYDYVQDILDGDCVFTGDVKSVAKTFGSSKNEDEETEYGILSLPLDNGFHRALISSTSDDEQWIAKHGYLSFLNLTVEYENNPKSFVTAYNWLDKHPAFWSRYKVESLHWSENSNRHIWCGVTTNKKGKTVIMLEHGAAVEPERTSHYHDLRLDVNAKTYEKAIIKLAVLVHKFFHVDGSERKNVEYVKSEWEERIDSSMTQLEER